MFITFCYACLTFIVGVVIGDMKAENKVSKR